MAALRDVGRHGPTARDDARTTARILVADDNADMRDYLSRLLSVRFQVESVGDGTAALEAIHNGVRPTSSSATS